MFKGRVRQVASTGLEPVTCGLEDRCSILLSYEAKGRTGWVRELRITRNDSMNPERQYHRWDSNPHWTDFKSVVSAYWTTAAQEEQGAYMNPVKRCYTEPCLPFYYSIYIVICQVELE